MRTILFPMLPRQKIRAGLAVRSRCQFFSGGAVAYVARECRDERRAVHAVVAGRDREIAVRELTAARDLTQEFRAALGGAYVDSSGIDQIEPHEGLVRVLE